MMRRIVRLVVWVLAFWLSVLGSLLVGFGPRLNARYEAARVSVVLDRCWGVEPCPPTKEEHRPVVPFEVAGGALLLLGALSGGVGLRLKALQRVDEPAQ